MQRMGENPNTHGTNEDIFVVAELKLLNPPPKIPTAEYARQFSVETVFYPNPWAVHRPYFHQMTEEEQKILRMNCPELSSVLDM